MSQFSATGDLSAISDALSGQYDVEREIGRGGMGVVYRARDLRLDRLVAIKTLPAQLANDASVRERFLREARTVARLSHPNIVPIYRADEIGGQVFFVMGFVDGDSLAGRVASGGPLSPRDTVPILRDVAAALGYAHRHGVVHRDVKTENILLDTTTGHAMVTDFGIARLAEAAPLTATGQVLGTVYYLSPEQVGGEPIDGRSDIYALGVVGFAALAGRFPFDGPLASAVLIAHVNKQPPRLSTMAPEVPATLSAIIDRCLAKNPADRFQTCEELDTALAFAQDDAKRVGTVSKHSPLVSDTEAHAVFKRAAELHDMTGVQPRPIVSAPPRDMIGDAQRTSGFKTADLRDAAREAGIGEQYVQHALVERGLAPAPAGPTAAGTVLDLTRRPKAIFNWRGEPSELAYEAVVPGEMSERDFDLLVDIIRRGAEDVGQMATVGRAFTWSSQSRRGRQLQVSVFPRNGRTTIHVTESLRQIYGGIYGGIIGGGGGGLGGMTFGIIMANGAEWIKHQPGVASMGAFVELGLASWAALGLTAWAVARTVANRVSRSRQAALKSMVEQLAAEAKRSIASG